MRYKKGLLLTLYIALFFGFIFFACNMRAASGVSTINIFPPIVEIKVNPGETKSQTITVTNQENKAAGLRVYEQNFSAADIYGAMKFDENGSTRISGMSWIKPAVGNLILGPRETKKYNFNVTVPADAEPGGHYTAMFFEQVNDFQSSDNSIGVTGRVGALLFITVNGDIQEKGSVLGASSSDTCSGVACSFKTAKFRNWGPVPFEFTFQNTGNIHVKAHGKIEISNILGQKIAEILIDEKTVLPQSSRFFEAKWLREPLFGYYKAKLTVEYGSLAATEHAQITFYGFPWKIVLPLTIIALLAWFFGRLKLRNRHKVNKKGLQWKKWRKPLDKVDR